MAARCVEISIWRFHTQRAVRRPSTRSNSHWLLVTSVNPPGTSKWNKIEHRMFCHITENWRGRPLVSRQVVVNLIGHTRTRSGLTIRSELDHNSYPTGQTVSDEQMQALNLKRDRFHGEWNYMLTPRQ